MSWMSVIYALGVLLLILPAALTVIRAPHALRNATVWLAVVTGLAWAYHLYGDKDLSAYINMPAGYTDTAPLKPDADGEKLPAAQAEEDSPIRNP